jgi:hypothetical protein
MFDSTIVLSTNGTNSSSGALTTNYGSHDGMRRQHSLLTEELHGTLKEEGQHQ